MRLLNYEKWESTRLAGKRPFVRWFALRIGLFYALSMSLVYVWADYRLYSLNVFTAREAVCVTAVVTLLLFILGPAMLWLCGELSWRINERLYQRHIGKRAHVAGV